MVDLADNALTTLAIVKEDLGISVGTYDDQLKRLINAASQYVENTCNRVFYRDTTIEEIKQGYGWTFMQVNRPPINSITSIKYNDEEISSDGYAVVDAQMGIIEKTGGYIWTAHHVTDISRTMMPGSERYLYTVEYDGGWYTPKQEDDNGANTRALPWDLENAAVDYVRGLYRMKGQNPNVSSESLMSWNTSYTGGDSSVIKAVKDTLAKYILLGSC